MVPRQAQRKGGPGRWIRQRTIHGIAPPEHRCLVPEIDVEGLDAPRRYRRELYFDGPLPWGQRAGMCPPASFSFRLVQSVSALYFFCPMANDVDADVVRDPC